MPPSAPSVVRPPRLLPGDTVAVIAPSGPVPRDDFDAGRVVLAGRYRLDYDPAVIHAVDGYLAGDDEARVTALNDALRRTDVKAVFMARGGYGLLRILPFIDVEALRAHPKPIVGFSDGTALLALAALAGVAAVHGPVITQLGKLQAADHAAFIARLENPGAQVLCEGLDAVVPGLVQGQLVGGNLEVFSRLLGTSFLPALDGAVLFIEDVGERPYRVDRLLTHLDLAGVFSRVAAVVVGDFVNCKEPEATAARTPTVEAVLEDRLGRLAIPVAFGAPIGHGTRNVALPYGTLVELDTRYGVLAAVEGAVS